MSTEWAEVVLQARLRPDVIVKFVHLVLLYVAALAYERHRRCPAWQD